MEQIRTGVSAQECGHLLTRVSQHNHVAAAAYLMKHAGATALIVVDAQTGQPAGIITEADIARTIGDRHTSK